MPPVTEVSALVISSSSLFFVEANVALAVLFDDVAFTVALLTLVMLSSFVFAS